MRPTEHYFPSPTIQPFSLFSVCFCFKSTHLSHPLIQTTPSRAGGKDIAGDQAGSLAQVEVNDIHCLPPAPGPVLLITEGNQACQAWFNLNKSMLTVPRPEIFSRRTSPRDGKQADRSVVAWIILLALLEKGPNACLLLLSCCWDLGHGALRWRRSIPPCFLYSSPSGKAHFSTNTVQGTTKQW